MISMLELKLMHDLTTKLPDALYKRGCSEVPAAFGPEQLTLLLPPAQQENQLKCQTSYVCLELMRGRTMNLSQALYEQATACRLGLRAACSAADACTGCKPVCLACQKTHRLHTCR